MSSGDGTSGSAAFLWGWKDGSTSTTLTECGSYGISVVSMPNSTTFGVPPYFLIAYKANGLPSVSTLGSDRSNLSWTVNHASGSSLVLAVADSRGMTGGVDPYIYTISSGSSTSCLPSAPTQNITLSANVSTSHSLEACDPLGLSVSGGLKPYTVSIAVLNSQSVTNLTLDSNDDVLTWPIQASPNNQFIASVSDAEGIWGTSTGIFNIDANSASNGTDCSVRPSSGNSTDVDQHTPEPSNATNSDSKSSNSLYIVAIVVPVVVAIGLFFTLVFFVTRRRRLRRANGPQPAILPDVWVGPTNRLSTRMSDVGRKSYVYAPISEFSNEPTTRASERRSERRIVQHQDVEDVQELPPPYLDRNARTGSSSSFKG